MSLKVDIREFSWIYTEEQVIITRLLGKEINLLIVRMNLDHAMLIVIDEVV